MQSSGFMIVAHSMDCRSKYTRFYLVSALEVYMCHNRLLFSIYNEENSPPICIADHAELVILRKGTVTLNMLVDSKPEIVNFGNVFYTSD